MDMIGYLGKKVDLTCFDGKKYSGYVMDVLDEEDSGIVVECVDISPLDSMHIIAIPLQDIKEVVEDERFIELNLI